MEVVEITHDEADSGAQTPAAAEKVASGLVKINGSTVEEFTQVGNLFRVQMNENLILLQPFIIFPQYFLQQGLGSIVQAMKAINAFPSGPNRTIYSSYPSFNTAVAQTSDQILGIIAKVLAMQKIKGNIQR